MVLDSFMVSGGTDIQADRLNANNKASKKLVFIVVVDQVPITRKAYEVQSIKGL
jgi:hypothetical protein